MNEEILYPALLIIAGIIISTALLILLTKLSNRIIRLFDLYPESRGILTIALKVITWFISLIVFSIFLRWA